MLVSIQLPMCRSPLESLGFGISEKALLVNFFPFLRAILSVNLVAKRVRGWDYVINVQSVQGFQAIEITEVLISSFGIDPILMRLQPTHSYLSQLSILVISWLLPFDAIQFCLDAFSALISYVILLLLEVYFRLRYSFPDLVHFQEVKASRQLKFGLFQR